MQKIKSIAEYQQLAKRTCLTLGSSEKDFRHMTLGVITEIGEALDIFKKNLAYKKPLDLVNLGEELADISWYIVNMVTFQGDNLEEIDFRGLTKEVEELLKNTMVPNLEPAFKTETILSMLLGYITTGEAIIDVIESPEVILSLLNIICDLHNLDYFQCLTNNIAKLKVRYPEKFTEEAALNRDLDSERVELEK